MTRTILLPAAQRRRFLKATAAGTVLAVLPLLACAQAARLHPQAKPTLYAHRGASALRPEHTLGSYAKAIADVADFVEPDLVATKDGVLVARHENAITGTTDVAARPEFAARKTRNTVDGETHEGWFVSDFTFAELKTLRAIERLPQMRGTAYDGQFQIVSFDEIIDFVAAEAAARGRTIGLIPELKHSTWFAQTGLPLEDRFVSALKAHAYTRRAPVVVQSFEIANLKALRKGLGQPSNVTLAQLVIAGAEYDKEQPADVVAPNTRADGPRGGCAQGGIASRRLDLPSGERLPRGRLPQRRRSERAPRRGLRRRDPALSRDGDRRPVLGRSGAGAQGDRRLTSAGSGAACTMCA